MIRLLDRAICSERLGGTQTFRQAEAERGREKTKREMENFTEAEDLEPLFDYTRVQPLKIVCLEDVETSPVPAQKRRKISNQVVEKKLDVKDIEVVNCEDEEEEDWLPPPPKGLVGNQLAEDSAIKELRLMKQELVSVAKSAKDVLQAVEDSVKQNFGSSFQASLDAAAEQSLKPPCERAKIVISVQDKEGLKQFRVYMDDKFERLFKLYADKVKLDMQNLVFCFDGEKIGPAATPAGLGMEDDDIIEVHVKRS